MNPIVIAIAILAVILMVAFGRNPVEEAREARKKAMEGKDPLIMSIEEHNKKPHMNKMFGSGSGPVGGTTTQQQNPNYPSYMMNNSNPYSAPNPYRPAPTPNADPAPQNGYYPPAAPGSRPSTLQSPRSELDPINKGGLRLKSGEQVKFDGTTMFALDDSGKPIALKDGKYPMFDGRLLVTVKNGKKTISKQ